MYIGMAIMYLYNLAETIAPAKLHALNLIP